MTETTQAGSVAPGAAKARRFYPAYVLGALMLINAFNVGDRAIIAIVQEPIKTEFRLTDFQLGLLAGPAFALVYTLCAIPVARLAERKSRVVIIAIALAAWSTMTVLCGMAASFIQLLAARMGVGIGESGSTPSAHSLIADYFPPERRAMAISIFSLGLALGAALLSVVGGMAAETWGWRGAFIVLGAPGVVFALIFILTVREPPRRGAGQVPPAFGPAIKALLAKPTFRWAALAGVLTQSGSAVLFYGGSYLMRLHHLNMTDVAVIQSVLPAMTGAVGMVVGGFVADRLVRRTPKALAIVPAVGLLLAGPLWTLAFLAPSVPVYLALFLSASLLASPALPLVFAIGQNVSDPLTRATASAVLLLATALIGQGLGVPVIGALSDNFAHAFMQNAGVTQQACAAVGGAITGPCATAAAEGLRWALAAFTGLLLLAGACLLMASRTLARDQVD